MRQELYLQKAEDILLNMTMYEKVDLTIESYETKTREVTLSECKNMDSKLLKSILPSSTKFPEWYGLPKDHKQNLPLRPVVAACDSPTTEVSIVLERVLQQLIQ